MWGGCGCCNLPSPDFISSNSSFSNGMNRQMPGISREQQVMQVPPEENRAITPNLVEPNNHV
ncbi:hypothetical protein LINPERPRIM_LOCUS30141, partial [Linum perenne]